MMAEAACFHEQSYEDLRIYGKILTSSGLLLILFPLLIHGMLKDGVTQWVPTYICDRCAVSASFSVILTMVLPLINLSGAHLVWFAQKKNLDRT